jgi:D-cysteine desulfhydrase
MAFQLPPRISIAHLPTPIQKLKKLSHELGRHEIYVKRDDLTGAALSGNKIRKLEFVAADALAKGADTLITCGGIQSNHARATAIVAATLGLKVHLVLRGTPDASFGGNLFLDRLVGAEFTFITPEAYKNNLEIMHRIARQLEQEGRQPYVVPEGASDALGSMGYLNAVHEMIDQCHEMKIEFEAIVCAVGSGGTHSGLLLGKFWHGLEGDILGVNVCDDASYFQNRIFGIIEDVKTQFKLDLGIKKSDIHLIDGYVGKGYALSRPEEITLIKHLARTEGCILDPVYTGKAMFGLLDQIKQGNFKNYQRILFLHSGGIYGLFPAEALFN